MKSQLLLLFLLTYLSTSGIINAQDAPSGLLDRKVSDFLNKNRYFWRDMNIPEADGRLLYDLIIRNNYTRALEIGTSTGHSAVWIAWALSKTGGKLTTIEINEDRYREALANFSEAGLSDFIDARLADAHILVPSLEGPFDFIFCDADKYWYRNYFDAVAPHLVAGGSFAAHNVNNMAHDRAMKDFIDYIRGLRNFETIIEKASYSGISVSRKLK